MQFPGITCDQFEQSFEDLLGDLGRPSHSLGQQDPFQTRTIELMNAVGYRVFAGEQDGGEAARLRPVRAESLRIRRTLSNAVVKRAYTMILPE